MTSSSPSDEALRLRAGGPERVFHVVLVEPEIPPNTGNIARLCGATRSVLHLVGQLGFRIDEHAVRRAGLDYWHLVDVRQHATLEEATTAIAAESAGQHSAPRRWLLSGKSTRSVYTTPFTPGDILVFGKESVGLPEELLRAHPDEVIGIPTIGAVRSLNLANAVAITLYEALRQVGALEDSMLR
ncbi:MAG TPA: tRNA (cytidine(34)-2'-O)-methyltransferase [Polyangiaceae bacterium]|jgi:tRNA (cytidine/uridine-2'-O-)-methyltransferase|nr:tRNA (cytidine(34)-2'-O)-methyltransferase [Polyangiaceae bacterium]